jgi:hypothetical protein
MSEERVICSHHLSIRFDQLEGNRVNWYVEPDDEVRSAQGLSLIDLAECGAPLSALGIRALWKLCIDGLVFNALEQANSIRSEVSKRLVSGPPLIDSEVVPEGVSIN